MKYARYLALALILVPLPRCNHSPKYPNSDHHDGSRFRNEGGPGDVGRGFFDILKWKLSGGKKDWPDWVDDNLKPDFTRHLAEGEAAVTFINHATEVIQLEALTVITDPVFSKRVSPVSWAGPGRHRAPGADIADLPRIDVVVLSHNHYDHTDVESLVALDRKFHPKMIVPLGNGRLLEESGIKDGVELDWWQNVHLAHGYTVTLVPTQHWSARGIFDRNEALWGGYVIESPKLKIFFAGDTGYTRHFTEIENRFGPMDVSILPIGAYEPRWFMERQHMDPADAVKAHGDLRSKLSIGTHFGTFQLTNEGIEDPVLDLAKARDVAHVGERDFVAPKNGQTIFFPRTKR